MPVRGIPAPILRHARELAADPSPPGPTPPTGPAPGPDPGPSADPSPMAKLQALRAGWSTRDGDLLTDHL